MDRWKEEIEFVNPKNPTKVANIRPLFLFQVIRCLLIHPNPESALNEDAGKMLIDSYEE